VAFAADGTSLVSSNEDGTVRLWDRLTPWQRLEQTRTALQADIASRPDWAEAHYYLGCAHHQLGEYNQAMGEYSKAIDLEPKFAPALNARSVAYVREGQWEKATADFARLVKLEPNEHMHWYGLAGLYLQGGDRERYRRICREMLTRFGNTEEIAERVAKTCLLAPDAVSDLGLPLKLADQAVTGAEKDPDYHWFVLTKGLAEYRAGRYAAAVDWMNRFSPKVDGLHYDATAFAVLAMAKFRLSGLHQRLEQSTDRAQTLPAAKAQRAHVPRLAPEEGVAEAESSKPRFAEEARAALGHAEAIVSHKMPDPKAGRPFGTSWPFRVEEFLDWLHARILTREAGALLGAEKKINHQDTKVD
jgi:tetratricopeptide (TPR) repeat protein